MNQQVPASLARLSLAPAVFLAPPRFGGITARNAATSDPTLLQLSVCLRVCPSAVVRGRRKKALFVVPERASLWPVRANGEPDTDVHGAFSQAHVRPGKRGRVFESHRGCLIFKLCVWSTSGGDVQTAREVAFVRRLAAVAARGCVAGRRARQGLP